LYHQAEILKPAIYDHLNIKSIKNMLEVGCGVGAQSSILLESYSAMHLTSIDQNTAQLERALEYRESLPKKKSQRWEVLQMDASKMTFPKNHFDGAFLCWILEHIKNPQVVVDEVFRVLRPNGVIIATEVMNSSFFIDPFFPNLWKYWQKFNDYQFTQAGDPYIGIKLRSIFSRAGLTDIQILGRIFHFDETCPIERKEFLLYWQDLMFSAEAQLQKQKIINADLCKKARADFKILLNNKKTIFTYTFFQCFGTKPAR
jgi:ubiquinone/menaquinone biosynthesis C-methylase UbiE